MTFKACYNSYRLSLLQRYKLYLSFKLVKAIKSLAKHYLLICCSYLCYSYTKGIENNTKLMFYNLYP
jgi:hypothetical protein